MQPSLYADTYTQTWLASRDAERLNTALEGRAGTIVPESTITAAAAPFDVSGYESYSDPYKTEAATLLATALAGVKTS
ncbi:hypothetical protein ACWC98_32965 [Streptomyces goshikiensis]